MFVTPHLLHERLLMVRILTLLRSISAKYVILVYPRTRTFLVESLGGTCARIHLGWFILKPCFSQFVEVGKGISQNRDVHLFLVFGHVLKLIGAHVG